MLHRAVVFLLLVWVSANASASVVLVQTSDKGFYNADIGSLLNGTNGGDTSTGYFPISDDSTVHFATPPDLSTAAGVLGNWLTDPLHLNGHWSPTQISIPNSWAVGTEVAVIYEFDTLGATNVFAQFGVDNGIFVWLDGNYIRGDRAGGTAILGEYQANLGNLSAGTHFLQLLLEDHGVTNGYQVLITADSFIQGPPPDRTLPEPSSLLLLAAGLFAWSFASARRTRRWPAARRKV